MKRFSILLLPLASIAAAYFCIIECSILCTVESFAFSTSVHRPQQQQQVVGRRVLPPLAFHVKSQQTPQIIATTHTSTTLLQVSKKDDSRSSSSDPDDVPDDWSEDDMLAEFGEDVDLDIIDDEEVEEVVAGVEVEKPTMSAAGDSNAVDEDDDELDLDEVDLDEIDLDLDEDDDDDEDSLVAVEEFVGEYNEEWEEDEELYVEGDLDFEDDEDDYELDDDTEDPNYMRQKEIVQLAIDASEKRAIAESFDSLEFVMNEMTPEQIELMESLPFVKNVEQKAQKLLLTEKDVKDIDPDTDLETVSDYMQDDPYPRHDKDESNFLQNNIGITDDLMEELDQLGKDINTAVESEPWDKVMHKDLIGWNNLSDETLEEMESCLEEIGGSSYNVTRWLLYDLDFNVSNLILAAVKHNRDAPILLQHWYPQLVTYKRYQHARDRNFDFSWDDVENADITELERYYAGFGYDEIPSKAPAETGIISLEDLDEEEIKMAAFENWMTEVYNPEWDRKDFDDDDIQDEDNVFSEFYEPPQHPDLPAFDDAVSDIEEWEEEMGNDSAIRNYRDMVAKKFTYKVVKDEEFEREFRGHLVVACSPADEDLEVAEKITKRFDREFGKQVYVETRAVALAREEDNVFEVWLESYEIDLLHSKKRATSNTQDWSGPADCDDNQIDYLVERVRFLISDAARYSYRMELEHVD